MQAQNQGQEGAAGGNRTEDMSSEERDADFSKLEAEEGAQTGSAAGTCDGDADSLRKELDQAHEKYLRALADFDNFKKRAQRERSELLKYQGDRIIYDLLQVVDNLELALVHSESDPQKLKEGIELIHRMFTDVLARWEVRGESAVGQEFDPQKHQAISQVAVDDAKPGCVINELKKAYFYKDKLLRPAEVVVAAEPVGSPDSGQDVATSADGTEDA